MNTLLRKLSVAAAILLSVPMVSQGSAYADAGAAVLVGSGTVSFGSFTLSTVIAIGAGIKPAAAGAVNCTFSGSGMASLPLGIGAGSASGTCSGSVNVGCSITFSQVGSVVVWDGLCGPGLSLVATFVLVPTTLNPTSSFDLTGVAAECGLLYTRPYPICG